MTLHIDSIRVIKSVSIPRMVKDVFVNVIHVAEGMEILVPVILILN